MSQPRVLFFAESASLAHLARPLAIARGLRDCEVTVAAPPEWRGPVEGAGLRWVELRCQSSGEFLRRAYEGKPAFDLRTLRAYREQDMEIIRAVKPDAVIGDLRISLQVSARQCQVPYLAIFNAHWSDALAPKSPVPDNFLIALLGVTWGVRLSALGLPIFLKLLARPVRRFRQENGMAPCRWALTAAYSDADYLLCADLAEFFVDKQAPAHYRFIGPPLWSYPAPLPRWWNRLPADRPVIYLTLGSSGNTRALQAALDELAGKPWTVIAVTAGQKVTIPKADNLFVADFLPGEEATRRCDVLVCNGGTMTAYQALRFGKPLVGLVSNVDQHLTMLPIVARGAGVMLRAETLPRAELSAAIGKLLTESEARAAAEALGPVVAAYDPAARVRAILREILGA